MRNQVKKRNVCVVVDLDLLSPSDYSRTASHNTLVLTMQHFRFIVRTDKCHG